MTNTAGCYDHVLPPDATPPSSTPAAPCEEFNRYGVRVPAVIISPWIAQGTMRPPGKIPFDHTSIIATLRRRFPELGPPLAERDAGGPGIEAVLALTTPDNMGSGSMPLPMRLSPMEIAQARLGPEWQAKGTGANGGRVARRGSPGGNEVRHRTAH